MVVFLLITSFVLACLSGLLLWQLLEQRKMIEQMLEREDIPEHPPEPELAIVLKVLDPIGLAKRESRAGRLIGDRLPTTATKMVYQEVLKELTNELEAREIDVDMQIEYR
ncbi:hypothetical protein [Marinobacter sp.]|uniref:hypothetical protein n=1 Tax=Marinobacter sp. TaxID=50741 RepID=UPI002B26DD1C|nr:hypothetical protein [Marinobacter sp.]